MGFGIVYLAGRQGQLGFGDDILLHQQPHPALLQAGRAGLGTGTGHGRLGLAQLVLVGAGIEPEQGFTLFHGPTLVHVNMLQEARHLGPYFHVANGLHIGHVVVKQLLLRGFQRHHGQYIRGGGMGRVFAISQTTAQCCRQHAHPRPAA